MVDFDKLKSECLVIDIETSASYANGNPINLSADFEAYVLMAEAKFIGMYSYKYNKFFMLETKPNKDAIRRIIEDHKFLVGFNNDEFDSPILENQGFINPYQKQINVDCMQILGNSTFKNRKGFKFKGRGELMDYKFKNNKLRVMAEAMGLETQKGDIDYKIFFKNSWTSEERDDIIKYLEADVKSTKEMFDKLWDYWMPFTDLLYENDIKNLSWLRSSIASLVYKSVCYLTNVEPIYGESKSVKEHMGGNVFEPNTEEKEGAWYLDFSSLYPHMFVMFNLLGEVDEGTPNAFHGNDLFKVKGYYNSERQNKITQIIVEKLKERTLLKKNDKDNPLVYTIKIWLNSLYGIARSAIFKQIHTPNCGWDCCWLGQQVQQYTVDRLEGFGFKLIAGDTDSVMVYTEDPDKNNREYVLKCLKEIVKDIQANVPFPCETFNIDIEKYFEYVMFPFSDQDLLDEKGNVVKNGRRNVKVRKGMKKNYLYVYEQDGKKEVELVGLPIKKDNATLLGIKIYNEVLKPLIIKNNRAKFEKSFIQDTIKEYLDKPGILESLSVEYKVKPSATYAKEGQIQAQISRGYLSGGDGIIRLIKNKKVGKAGKGSKYCTIQEAKEAKLTIDDLDLTKIYNELRPFEVA